MSRPPEWMESLVDTVSRCIEAHSAMGPLGFRYRDEEDLSEMIVYPTPVELIGGAVDGEVVLTGFSLDLQELVSTFDRVDSLHWFAHGFGPLDNNGPHISIEGDYQGHFVWLQILAEPPEDEEPGIKYNTIKKRIKP